MHNETLTLDISMVTFDCIDPERLARWWAGAIAGEMSIAAPGEFVTVASPQGLRLGFQNVPDPTPGKNRLHLDLHSHHRERDVARLIAVGATEVSRRAVNAEFGWVVLADPDGNVFCVAGAP
ncbi:VOC family protein [Mycobacterium sp. 21AC1]|uniref:VOC family protein n=1 Tax=[Mycobacterium] appelbergii TaxID=2939269 RepID=UPI0029391686|nr:VOC family protein [Mycobacterium sp. 21AC1]MDV3126753.1 VOC family protein [Mycobacterium sp. 21AC1]